MTAPANRRRHVLRIGAGVVVAALATVAIVQRGGNVVDAAHRLDVLSLIGAGVTVLAGIWATMLSWRALLAGSGSPLSIGAAAQVFFLGQLGKYVPGSVWPVLAQMELGRRHHVPRARSAAVGLCAVAIGLLAGMLVAAVTLPFTSQEALHRYWYGFLVLPVLAVGAVPAVTNAGLDRVLRLARRPPLDEPLTGRGILLALAWQVLAWLLFGLHVALLAHALGAGWSALALSTGAFALAWTVGFLVVIAPAGAGVREAALVLAMSPVLSRDDALLVALVSRALMSVGDGFWALLAVVNARRTGMVDAARLPTT